MMTRRFCFRPYSVSTRDDSHRRPVRPRHAFIAFSRHMRDTKITFGGRGGRRDDAIQSLLRTAEDDDDDDDATPSSLVLLLLLVGRDAAVLLLLADSATSLPTKRPIEHILAPSTSSGRNSRYPSSAGAVDATAESDACPQALHPTM